MSIAFVSGGTGYLGRPLIESLVGGGWDVRALCRPQSIRKVPVGATVVPGNALAAHSFVSSVPSGAVYVHLTGVAHPNASKAASFRTIDQTAFRASLQAAQCAGVKRFVYVSVAHPAPVMRAYVAVRMECERELLASSLDAVILRPWYVLGPGHWWPCLLSPFYTMAGWIPALRSGALRLGLLTHRQMTAALVHSVQNREPGVHLLDVPGIRAINSATISA